MRRLDPEGKKGVSEIRHERGYDLTEHRRRDRRYSKYLNTGETGARIDDGGGYADKAETDDTAQLYGPRASQQLLSVRSIETAAWSKVGRPLLVP